MALTLTTNKQYLIYENHSPQVSIASPGTR